MKINWKILLLFFTPILATILTFVYNESIIKLILVPLIIIYIYVYVIRCNIIKYMSSGIGLCLNILIFIRYLFIPFLIIIDSEYMNNIVLSYGNPNSMYFVYGVILTLYESVFVGMYLIHNISTLCSVEYYQEEKVVVNNVKNCKFKKTSNLFIIFCIFVFIALVLFCDSSVVKRWNLVFLLNDSTVVYLNSVTSLRTTIALISFRNILLLLPIPFLSLIHGSLYDVKNDKKSYIKTIVTLIGCYGLLIEGTSRASAIIPLIATLVCLMKLYPKKKKTTIIYIGTLLISVIIISTIWKSYSRLGKDATMSLDDFLEMLEIYFQGISNMGKALMAKIDSGIILPRIDYLLNDLITTIPLISHLSNINDTATAQFWAYTGGRKDQVLSAIGGGLFYFGYLLSPFVCIFQIKVASIFEKKANNAKSIGKFLVCTYASLMLIYGCYSSVVIFIQKLILSSAISVIISSINEKV